MTWAMQDEAVKVQMFRFIDVLPMLSSADAIVTHLHEYFNEVRARLPWAARLGLPAVRPGSAAGRVVAKLARRNALGHARRFIAGTNTQEVLKAARRERDLQRAFTLDILGEAVASEVEAERYLQSYLDLIAGIAPTVNSWPAVPQIDQDAGGELPRVNVSVKLSALDSQFDAIDPEGTTQRAGTRLRRLLRVAREHRAYVHVDMESYKTKDLTLSIFQQVMMEDEFRTWSDVGIVIQCYLRDAEDDLIRLRDWAVERGTPVWVRLVKGAYWDYETVHAKSIGWTIPVFEEKWQSDANFERQTRFVMGNQEHLRAALGSHNIRSLAHGIAVARHLGLRKNAFELQMLYGMADAEKQAIVDSGHRLRIYMPYGELIPGMAYLVRRLLENTSNDSFLRASFTDNVSPEKLLMNPADGKRWPADDGTTMAVQNADGAAIIPLHSPTSAAIPQFRNEPATDFAIEANRRAMREQLDQVKRQLAQHYSLRIAGQSASGVSKVEARNPAQTHQLIGTVAEAGPADVEQAVAAAKAALPDWNAAGVLARAEFLRESARVMRQRRFELAAWEVLECGKGWREADADVAEAIDFCEYYAAGAVALQGLHGVNVPGEENQFEYLPRGVVAVIAPWNFPLAILTGMTTAALATGNTVVMKPSEQSAVIGAKLMEVFDAATKTVGVPSGIVNYLPGRGEIVGAKLVEHPDVAVIAFTGSRKVGLETNRRAAEVSASGISSVKRVIAEMGGKNAIIIDSDADLDEAVLAVVKSAFGYQGQKCSACSRCIVLADVYDQFLTRLVEATRSLKIGLPEEPGTSVGPVIDADSLRRVKEYIEIGRRDGREVLSVQVGGLAEQGYFVGPHIFADVRPNSRLAQEEIFGPVLAVIRAADLDEAIRITNGTDYALTGGIFSRSPANLDRARRALMVGNLYLNRGITGALVGRQPFGGFKMSGIGSKAGGPDYLLQFVLPRTVTENTMRRGFAPPAENQYMGAAEGPGE